MGATIWAGTDDRHTHDEYDANCSASCSFFFPALDTHEILQQLALQIGFQPFYFKALYSQTFYYSHLIKLCRNR